jgi:hypothetical protein
MPELPGAGLKPGKRPISGEIKRGRHLFPASFGGIIHVAFLGHDCQIKQAERDDNEGYD